MHSHQDLAEITTIEDTHPTQVIHTTKRVLSPQVPGEHPQKVFEKKKTIFRFYQVIWYVLGIIEVLLGFRMLLKALGANPFSAFVTIIYALSDPLALPFQGIFRATVTGGSVFEWSTIFAAAVYALIAYGLVELFQLVKPVTPEEVEQEVDEQ